MNFTFSLVVLVLTILIAFSAAKGFWSAPLEMLQKQAAGNDKDEVNFEKYGIMSVTPIPTSTSISSTSSATSTMPTTTTSLEPCINGCIPSIGTRNGPIAPIPFDTTYNGRDPRITSYPTNQP